MTMRYDTTITFRFDTEKWKSEYGYDDVTPLQVNELMTKDLIEHLSLMVDRIPGLEIPYLRES